MPILNRIIWGIALFALCSTQMTSNTAEETASRKTEPLSLQAILEARNEILSNSIDFSERVKLAADLVIRLEKRRNMQLSQIARRICLDFYASIPANLKNEATVKTVSPLGNDELKIADLIDKGKRKEALEHIHALLENQSPFHPSLSVLALKADDMLTCYYAFFENISNGKITPYTLYIVGYLATREERWVEAEQLLSKTQGRLGNPLLEKWLFFDLAKIQIVQGNMDQANKLIEEQLKKAPNDPAMLYLRILSLISRQNEDEARKQLARLVPHLNEDSYLLANIASAALRLNEINTAATILEKFESKVEPNKSFHEAFALVRKAQGRNEEAEEHIKKAEKIPEVRVPVAGMLPPSELLDKIVSDIRAKKQEEVESLKGVDALAKVYLYLLDYDAESAVNELKQLIKDKPNSYPWERFTLAVIQRRIGLLSEAVQNVKILHENHPGFRSYQVLSWLADFHYRTGDTVQSLQYYKELQKRFPGSFQAEVAKQTLALRHPNPKDEILNPINTSPLMTRFTNYAAPFVLTEINRYWGDRVSFAVVSGQLRTSPRRGLDFDKLIGAFIAGTRYRIVPFVGQAEVIHEYLQQKIPVVFCQGEMFAGNSISNLEVIVGADPSRGQFYAEGVTPSSPHLLTEAQILEGICLAIYPDSLSPAYSELANNAIKQGELYAKELTVEANKMRTDEKYPGKVFHTRLNEITKFNNKISIPQQLAFARWMVANESASKVEAFLDAVLHNCTNTALYWFIKADFAFRQENIDLANRSVEQILSKNPDHPRYVLAKVRILHAQGKTEEALKITEDLSRQFPEDVSVSAHLVAFYKQTGQEEKSKAEENRLKEFLHIESIELDLNPLKK